MTEYTVHLDRERRLRFDYDSLADLTRLPQTVRSGKDPIQLWASANGLDIDAMAIMLWASCRHEDKDFTIDKAKAGLKQTLKLGRTTFKELNQALNGAVHESKILGLVDATEDGDDAGNAQTPSGSSA